MIEHQRVQIVDYPIGSPEDKPATFSLIIDGQEIKNVKWYKLESGQPGELTKLELEVLVFDRVDVEGDFEIEKQETKVLTLRRPDAKN